MLLCGVMQSEGGGGAYSVYQCNYFPVRINYYIFVTCIQCAK